MSWILSNSTEEFREEERRHGADDGMAAYLLLEAALCECVEDPCDCGWDNTEEDE